MVKKCPDCGFKNPDIMKFCGNCGNPFIEKKKVSELRDIAVLFIDMVGFTSFSEGKDPEEVSELLNKYWKIVSEIVEKYDCYIDKYIGDAVLILCGFPHGHENDSERAILIALEIINGMRGLNLLIKQKIQFRFGIHYGNVFAGDVGGNSFSAKTVIGDVVNTAERIQELADPDTIYVSYDIYEFTNKFFDFQKVGNKHLKGKEEEIGICKVLGRKNKRKSFRGIEGLNIPMVGRDEELKLLVDKFSNITASKSIEIGLIRGGAGIGKSRLSEEFLSTVKQKYSDKVSIIKGRCLPYGESFVNWPIIQLVKTILGIEDSDTAFLIKGKIKYYLRTHFGGFKIELIDADKILGLLLGAEETIDIEPEKIRNQTILVFIELLKKESLDKYLVVVIEDIHWIDFSSIEILRETIKRLDNVSLLLLLITRPEYKESITCKNFLESLTQDRELLNIKLDRLSRNNTRKMVELLLEIEKLPDKLKELIISHSEGNPFFTEEIIKSLIDREILVSKGDSWHAVREITDIDIPKTVTSVIQARVDTLSEDEKQILQTASVIGKTFWKKILDSIIPNIKTAQFQGLLDRGLIKNIISMAENELQYKFKHILIQEVVYRSIVKKIKRELHLRIAGWIENSYSDNLEGYYDLLAIHYNKGGNEEKAIEYIYLAGEKAKKNYANSEALALLENVVRKTKLSPEFNDYRKKAKKSIANIYSTLGKNEKAIEDYQEALNLTKDERENKEIRISIGEVYQRMSDYNHALKIFNDVLSELSSQRFDEWQSVMTSIAWIKYLQGDIKKMGKIIADINEKLLKKDVPKKEYEKYVTRLNNLYGIYHSNKGDWKKSIEYYKKNIEIYERQNDLGGVSTTYNNIAENYSQIGDFKKCIGYYEKSLNIAEKTGEMLGQAIPLYNLGETYLGLNALEKAEEYLNKYMIINRQIDNHLGIGYGSAGLGSVYLRRKNYPKAMEYFNNSYQMFDKLGSRSLKLYAFSKIIKGLIIQGQLDEAREKFSIFKQETNDDKDETLLYFNGLLEGESGNYIKAVEILDNIIKSYKESGNIEEIPNILLYKIKYEKLNNDRTAVKKTKAKMEELLNKLKIGIPDEFVADYLEYYKN